MQEVERSFVVEVENQEVVIDVSLVVVEKVKLLEVEEVGKEEGREEEQEEENLRMVGAEMKLEEGHWLVEEP